MDKRELNEKILDEILKYAAEKSTDDMAATLPSDEELDKEVSFRPEFTDRMSKLFTRLRHRERNRRMGKAMLKVGASVAAVLIIFTTVVFSVDAVRVSFLNMFTENNNDSTTIHVGDRDVNYDAFASSIHGLYLPNYVPPSYSVQDVENLQKYYFVVFANTNGDTLQLQSLLEYSSTGVDNEGATIEQVTVNGEDGQYFSKDGFNTLVFKFNQKAFVLSAFLSKEELIKIAQSMEYRP